MPSAASKALAKPEPDAQRMPAGVILTGSDMDQLLTESRRLAAQWLCVRQPGPCMTCSACAKVLASRHVDVTYINEGAQTIIKVATIRAMRRDMLLRPFDGEGKVVVIAYADNLNAAAQNALLTLLEEPPLYVRMILLCANTELLLPTVRSRCALLRLPPAEAEPPSPETLFPARRYLAALSSDWERTKVAFSWEKSGRDDLKVLLGVVLHELRGQILGAPAEHVPFYMEQADKIMGCMEALENNASVGIVCGLLAL